MTRLKADLQNRGFAQVEALFSPAELAEVETLLDALLLNSAAGIKLFRRELADQAVAVGGGVRQPEIIRPSRLSRRLRCSAVYRHCQALASALLDCPAHYQFDHAIYKMPGSATPTPWHQDQAYLGEMIPLRSLHFWIPLQDCAPDNGSLCFATISPRQLLPHIRPFPDNPHVLQVAIEPTEHLHELRLCRGGASIHTPLTLHAAGINRSAQIRKAWIVHFSAESAWTKGWWQLRSWLGLPVSRLPMPFR